ncbi:MAG TPA: DUF4232 domain-containing protein [Streptosporangiaceae bacterium]|nr:DUF4232 domain-containing protein [Streptosporangiaceae bacterium]
MMPGSCPHARAIAGAWISGIVVLFAGCGATGSSAGPGKTITVTASPAAPASTAPATPAPATSPAAPAGPAACPTRYLSAKAGVSQGTAGSTYTVIDFTNISNVTCTLYGYPGVSLAGGSPVTQIGLAAAENPSPPRELVTLAPRAVASALLRVVHAGDFPPARCHPVTATYLQIFPPNQTTPIYLGYRTATCAKPVRILTISVVQPGSGSS